MSPLLGLLFDFLVLVEPLKEFRLSQRDSQHYVVIYDNGSPLPCNGINFKGHVVLSVYPNSGSVQARCLSEDLASLLDSIRYSRLSEEVKDQIRIVLRR